VHILCTDTLSNESPCVYSLQVSQMKLTCLPLDFYTLTNSITMFTQLLALVAALAIVRADPVPQTPEGVQKVGGDCTITWTPDNTGVWKTMHIELMAGDNLAMEHLTSM
jgi:hypothetical protein